MRAQELIDELTRLMKATGTNPSIMIDIEISGHAGLSAPLHIVKPDKSIIILTNKA